MTERYIVTRWVCADRRVPLRVLRPRWIVFDTHLAECRCVMWDTKAQATVIARHANQLEKVSP